MEAQVLEEDNLAVASLVDDALDLGADTVGREGHRLAQQLLKLRHHGLQAVLGIGAAVGASQVGHQDHCLGAVVEGMLDGGDGARNALVVGDLLVGIERDVEVDLSNEQLSDTCLGPRHFGELSLFLVITWQI